MSLRYFGKKLGVALLTLTLVSLITFFLLRMMPGDAVFNWARQLSNEQGIDIQEARRQVILMINYNPDEPLRYQFVRYYGNLLRGNLGDSFIYKGKTVNSLAAYAMPWTLLIVVLSLFCSFFLGTQLGGYMAWRRKSILTPIMTMYSTITNAVPFYIFAILLQVFLCFNLGWFPMNGAYDAWVTPGFNFDFIVNVLWHAAMPVLAYVITQLGGWALQMKGSAISILGEDYINAANARGIPSSIIRRKYVIKNAMLPLFTSVSMQFGMMLGGAVLIENTFRYPGMGSYIANAITQRDLAVWQGMLLITSAAILCANFLAEMVYSKMDPRIKVEE
ncbi:MAG: ABC transporter permease [Oscillospiraceae bacterium]|nr:ABC transporter permease [Oscillospiraceae bacterium]